MSFTFSFNYQFKIIKGEHFYKYFFLKLIPVIFRNFHHFFAFLLNEMFFGLPLGIDLKSQKFKKWREFLIVTELIFEKKYL